MCIISSVHPKSESLLFFILSWSNRFLVSSYFQYSQVERDFFGHIREFWMHSSILDHAALSFKALLNRFSIAPLIYQYFFGVPHSRCTYLFQSTRIFRMYSSILHTFIYSTSNNRWVSFSKQMNPKRRWKERYGPYYPVIMHRLFWIITFPGRRYIHERKKVGHRLIVIYHDGIVYWPR